MVPLGPALAVMIQRSIVKLASLASLVTCPAPSWAETRTRAWVVGVFGTAHAYEPEFAIPAAIVT